MLRMPMHQWQTESNLFLIQYSDRLCLLPLHNDLSVKTQINLSPTPSLKHTLNAGMECASVKELSLITPNMITF
jgi:hypothetical protein